MSTPVSGMNIGSKNRTIGITYAYDRWSQPLLVWFVYSEWKFPTLFLEDHNNSQCFMFYQNVLEMARSQIQGQRYEDFCLLCHVGTRKKQKAPLFFMKAVFAYLCIFRAFFRAILKEPNLRFESAHLTSSKRLFDELIKALWQPQRGSLTKPPRF